MNLSRRMLIAAACLALGVAAEVALQWHLARAPESPYPTLRQELAACPLELATRTEAPSAGASAASEVWKGIDLPGLEELRASLPFHADDLVLRAYREWPAGPLVNLYLVHSRIGDDRRHHPEVCIREVTGAPEDLDARALVYLDGEHQRAVQRFRFRTGTGQTTTVYYWHYTFEPAPQHGQSLVQFLHQRLSKPAPSLTVQVASAASPEELVVVEKSFLVAVDATLQKEHLPAGTRIGCDRQAVSLIRE
jgi:hypothetical protein